MKPYKLLVFDFDGTLVDTVADIAHHANAVLKEFSFPTKPLSHVQDGIGHGVHELLKHLAGELGEDSARLEQAVVSFKKRYQAEPVVHTRPFPSVAEMLEGPLKDSKKAILTNKPQGLTEIILAKLDLSRHFEIVVGLDSGFPAKPDPSAFLHILDHCGYSAKESVLIGDSRVDRKTAENAGVDFVWVDYGYDDLSSDLGAARRISSAREWGSLVYGSSKGVL